VAHGVRWIKDLAYSDFIANDLPEDEFVGEVAREKLIYYPTVTREPFRNQGRLSLALTTGKLTETLGTPRIDAAQDRFMLCGSSAMLADVRAILDARGFTEGNHGEPGDYVIEKAFVDK
jgi:ferredoxin--NADP+ reductase